MYTKSKNINYFYAAAAIFILLMGGCATYHPGLLTGGTDLATRIEQLDGQNNISSPGNTGLSLNEVAVLAVNNNPDLKAKRKQLGIRQAELFAQGLLTDPRFSASLDHPTGNLPGLFTGYGIGLGYDFISLINRGARVDSADKAREQTRLEILWQEWQVSQRARVLAVNLYTQLQKMNLLEEMKSLYEKHYSYSREAMARGDVTLGVVGTDLTALLDTLSRIGQIRQAINDIRHELNLLLGLAAEVKLTIQMSPLPDLPDVNVWRQELKTLPRRRPDLLALQAGYQSQEEKVRSAILSQFPSLSIGISHARDTSNVKTIGFSIDFSLPLFSGNRGGIEIERATREQLAAEYQVRLDQAATEIERLIQLQRLVAEQLEELDEYLPLLEALVDSGRNAYQKDEIDAVTFLNMENTWTDKRLEQIELDQTQYTNLIALQTLLALPAEVVTPHNETQGGKHQ